MSSTDEALTQRDEVAGLAAHGMIYLQEHNRVADDDQIMLANKNYYDSGDNATYPMVMSGTLTAPDSAPPGQRLA